MARRPRRMVRRRPPVPTFEGAGFTCATGRCGPRAPPPRARSWSSGSPTTTPSAARTLNAYGGGGSGKGISRLHRQPGRLRRLGLGAEGRPGRPGARPQRCANNDAINLPMVTGPIALAYNLSGVDKLILTPEVLAGIFGGTITTWNDPAIAAINPGVTLPSLAIQAVHRAGGLRHHRQLHQVPDRGRAGAWTFDAGKSWTAPGGIAAQGSDGVAKQVKQHRRFHRLRRVGLRPGRRPGHRPDRQRRRRGRTDRRVGRQGRRGGDGRRHRQGPGAEARLRDQGRRAPTRSSWSPTRSSARPATPRHRRRC